MSLADLLRDAPLLCVQCGKQPRHSSYVLARFCVSCRRERSRRSANAANARRRALHPPTPKPTLSPEEIEGVARHLEGYERAIHLAQRDDLWCRWPDLADRILVPALADRRIAPPPTDLRVSDRIVLGKRAATAVSTHPKNCAECSAVVFMRALGMLDR